MTISRVLVVDDDCDLAECVADMLIVNGFAADTALCCDDAIEKFRKNDYDAVILDVKMPQKSGVDCFFELKVLRPDIKVVLMTGFALDEIVGRALEQGAVPLRKPFDMEALIAVLGRL